MSPTLIDLLGMEFSADEFEGRSLAPAILGSGPVPVRDFSVAETRLDTAEQSTLLRKSWKLVVDERASPATTSLYRYRDGELQLEDLSEERRTLTRRLVMKLRLWQVERRGRLPEAAAWGSALSATSRRSSRLVTPQRRSSVGLRHRLLEDAPLVGLGQPLQRRDPLVRIVTGVGA